MLTREKQRMDMVQECFKEREKGIKRVSPKETSSVLESVFPTAGMAEYGESVMHLSPSSLKSLYLLVIGLNGSIIY